MVNKKKSSKDDCPLDMGTAYRDYFEFQTVKNMVTSAILRGDLQAENILMNRIKHENTF